jgi:hypothetical protein
MRKTFCTVTLMAGILVPALSFAQWGQGGSKTITCESERDRQAYCRTYTTGRVELRRQLSKASCREYDTWGATGDGSGVWVRDGCRAEFVVEERRWGGGGGRDRDDDETTFTCKSKHYDYNHCDVPGGRGRRIELVRQISKAKCERGNTWGEDSRGVWVMNGCEGEFSARY